MREIRGIKVCLEDQIFHLKEYHEDLYRWTPKQRHLLPKNQSVNQKVPNLLRCRANHKTYLLTNQLIKIFQKLCSQSKSLFFFSFHQTRTNLNKFRKSLVFNFKLTHIHPRHTLSRICIEFHMNASMDGNRRCTIQTCISIQRILLQTYESKV